MAKGGWVYIMVDRYRGRMYVGITADLVRRVYQLREGKGSVHMHPWLAHYAAWCALVIS